MDLQLRAISNKHNVKITIVDLSEAMQAICDLQKTDPLISFALSKFSVANTLIAVDNKDNNKISTAYSTQKGLIQRMITEFEHNQVRSSVKVKQFDINKVHDHENPFDIVLGQTGEIYYSRDMGLKKPYVSTINTKTSNIDYMFMDFLRESNQINSLITTNVSLNENLSIKKAVGILIQLLPNHSDADIEFLESKIGNTKFLDEVLLHSTNYYEVIKEIVSDAEVLASQEIIFKCTCTAKKILNAVKLLGKTELQEIINTEQPLVASCDFCNKEYEFKRSQLLALVK